jgi:predicted nucleic acid-binding Zn ribbon protein
VNRRRVPRPLASAVQSALEQAAPATLLASVQRAWAGAVGEAVAREATPVAERDGVVTVACRSSTWAQELDLLSDQILSRLRSELTSGGALEGLRFSVSAEPF